MSEYKGYLTHTEQTGSINISEDVIAAIAAGAITEVEGVAGLMNTASMTEQLAEQFTGKKPTRGVQATIGENDEVTLNVFLTVQYGFSIPEVAAKVQESLASAVGSMTGFSIRAVNVHVGGISFNA